jgi:uncharacterized membrane protein
MPELKFRNRAREVSRVEAFSDVVFGFALTLIVISLEVPRSFDALMNAMRGFLGFAICFAVLTWIWHCHYTFFRRYALQDGITITLNALLLFIVLFYVYPMKFMFSIITREVAATYTNARQLFVIYGLGFAGIFLLFVLLYLHAYKLRAKIRLNAVEVHMTRTMMIMYTSYVFIGLFSVALALTLRGWWMFFAGWCYFLIGPASGWIGYKRGRALELLHSGQVQTAQRIPNSSATAAVPMVAANGPTRSDATPEPTADSAIVSVTNP